MRSCGIGAIMSTPGPSRTCGAFAGIAHVVAHAGHRRRAGARPGGPCRMPLVHPGHGAGRRDPLPGCAVVHARHRAMVHAAHAHVAHGEDRALAQRRHRARSCPGAARASPGPCRNGPSPRRRRCRRDPRSAGRSRHRSRPPRSGTRRPSTGRTFCPSALTTVIGRPGMRTLKIVIAAGVDDPEAHPLAGPEQPGPVLRRAVAVDQIGVGRAVDVEDVGRVHPHLRQHRPCPRPASAARDRRSAGRPASSGCG